MSTVAHLESLIRQLQGRFASLVTFAEVTTQEIVTSGTYVNLATVGPSITIPADADYLIGIGAGVSNSLAGQESWMSYTIGAASALDADCVKFSNVGTTNKAVAVSRFMRKANLSAGTVLTAKYRVGSGTGTWEARWLLAIRLL